MMFAFHWSKELIMFIDIISFNEIRIYYPQFIHSKIINP